VCDGCCFVQWPLLWADYQDLVQLCKLLLMLLQGGWLWAAYALLLFSLLGLLYAG
jgi:hypothetical protein